MTIFIENTVEYFTDFIGKLSKILPSIKTISKGKNYLKCKKDLCSSVTQSCPTLQPHGLQHTRLPCPSPSPGACSNSCPLSQSCHPTIPSSVIPFSSCLQSFPESGSFPVNKFFESGGQSIGATASASVLPMNIQD